MFEIREKSDEALITLKHGETLFHDALSAGKRMYHVLRQDGKEYDIVYTRNFDYVLPLMPEAYRSIEVYWDFLTYDEEDAKHIVLDQFRARKKIVFREVNEYSIVIGRVLLRERKDMELYYTDSRILWFLPESCRLHTGEDLPDDTDEVLFVTEPAGNSYQSTTGNKLSILAVFQSMFFLQAVTDRPLDEIRYLHMQFDSGLTGIGAIMSQIIRYENTFSAAGWKAYVKGDYIGKYPRTLIDKYMNIPGVPGDATEENTLHVDILLLSKLAITYTGMYADRTVSVTWFRESFLHEMEEYAGAVIGNKKMLGVFIRGTDYITTGIPGAGKQATAAEMIPLIHEWLGMYSFDGIFLATEDQGILDTMMDEFGSLIRIVSQERFHMDDFKTVRLIAELEDQKYDPAEKMSHIEDMTVNYFYAMYILAKCDSFIASGVSNGVDIVNGFNQNKFQHYYKFAVGMTQGSGTR